MLNPDLNYAPRVEPKHVKPPNKSHRSDRRWFLMRLDGFWLVGETQSRVQTHKWSDSVASWQTLKGIERSGFLERSSKFNGVCEDEAWGLLPVHKQPRTEEEEEEEQGRRQIEDYIRTQQTILHFIRQRWTLKSKTSNGNVLKICTCLPHIKTACSYFTWKSEVNVVWLTKRLQQHKCKKRIQISSFTSCSQRKWSHFNKPELRCWWDSSYVRPV